ncbi:uncharacterized protein LAESUDRAFT_731026 [Laetiporus sulphureus 93-53]|uniref:Uncharacterized protein n=1 Tax=Laetiporus sulphureus 93-53 TaxID=1314785 RepID=A0A165BTC4_9APHY|nr:uncharacterized protein LAESUDRAFT_731026 [Laetiporus sulphureus 93-53]KZT01613.1 hypothetical protein LAESUDRAFT_731026 [Laetiporus sulphureus 93-53]
MEEIANGSSGGLWNMEQVDSVQGKGADIITLLCVVRQCKLNVRTHVLRMSSRNKCFSRSAPDNTLVGYVSVHSHTWSIKQVSAQFSNCGCMWRTCMDDVHLLVSIVCLAGPPLVIPLLGSYLWLSVDMMTA